MANANFLSGIIVNGQLDVWMMHPRSLLPPDSSAQDQRTPGPLLPGPSSARTPGIGAQPDDVAVDILASQGTSGTHGTLLMESDLIETRRREARVAGWSHIVAFMAGATSQGLRSCSQARNSAPIEVLAITP